ncbi:hypothetical protein QCN29_11290 [Streptomyces sp. HNM0663]|uniref:Uncharacterized protein n=1 Tax=Streptomyces chengmaiensis TaxID=3040919 RepID=A0ABT6HKU7_9ACTN|nr:hypothetical protein [Streptomyces chengmaiensis]MDH2389366.1 hypothetical protein [Streptomyces chengmaiensis]
MTVRTRLPLPLAPLGYRRDGRPIFPILGASSDDPGNSPTGETAPDGTDTAVVTIPQEELSRRFAREKDQGRRAGVRDLLSQLGFESAKALTEYVQAQREADQQQKDAEQARLSEAERREQTAAERERQAQEREAAAVARERDAARRAVLVGLGATGTELEDAVVLLGRLVDQDADDTALTRAADELKERRPELFGQRAPQPPAAPPSGSPSNIPGRSGGAPPRPGQLGLDIARRRGHLKSS